jgi:hypothetical protein
MSCATSKRLNLRGAFTGDQNTLYRSAGFMLDGQDYVHLLISYETKVDAGYRTNSQSGFKTMTLFEMEQTARAFRSGFSSDDTIFCASTDALAHQTSLGYVCYQMMRRLQRLEHEHFPETSKLDYNKPLDKTRMSEIIRAAVKGEQDQNGFLTNPLYNEIRAANIQRAMPHEIQRRESLSLACNA